MMPAPGELQPATNAAVLRRGGLLRVLRRHGSHVRNVGGHESRALQVVHRRARASSPSSNRDRVPCPHARATRRMSAAGQPFCACTIPFNRCKPSSMGPVGSRQTANRKPRLAASRKRAGIRRILDLTVLNASLRVPHWSIRVGLVETWLHHTVDGAHAPIRIARSSAPIKISIQRNED